jgi:hypothetical protein
MNHNGWIVQYKHSSSIPPSLEDPSGGGGRKQLALPRQAEPTPCDETYPSWQFAFDFFNAHLFGRALPPVLLTLQRKANTCGYFSAKRFGNLAGEFAHEIALNPEWFAITSLQEVCQTLVHEMVHLWQHVHGKVPRGRYHDRQWADKMESLGLMPSHTGQPGGKRTGDCMADYIIPGGRFHRALQELVVEHGFAITWFDRSPPGGLANPRPSELLSMDAPALALTLPLTATQAPIEQGLKVERKDLRQAVKLTDSSNRVKFTCPRCKANAWGKPSLRIACLNPECEGAAFEG